MMVGAGGKMPQPIRSLPMPWRTVVLLCGKCARKLDGGYGPDGEDTLRFTLRAALKKTGRHRDVRIMETRCMGICPKQAVSAMSAARPEIILTVPKQTPPDEVLSLLLGDNECRVRCD